jgi:glucose-6-phosphate 1-dehydrogenase
MHTINPTIFVIFGVAGDLTWRKLVPALFNLYLGNRLPERFTLIGLDRVNDDDPALRQRLASGVRQFSRQSYTDAGWQRFSQAIHYQKADFDDTAAYRKLGERLKQIEQEWQTEAEHVFYMATPSFLFAEIATKLGEAGLADNRPHARLVIEKPIGHDLQSALELDQVLLRHFQESQLYRIDHYLGKETVQNIMAFRFANPMFEPIWNRHYVDHIAITVAETLGIGHRAGYYEHAGALRDMVQNHLMQLLCLVAMEPPVSFEADEIRNKKADVLRAVRPFDASQTYQYAVRGQYGTGWVQGEHVPAYRSEAGVDPESNTETYVALKLFVDNWRWQDVPFYLRTGKRMPAQISEISIRFRAVPHHTFPSSATLGAQPGRLVICIQPDEGIVLKFHAKQPGQEMRLLPVDMHFSYEEAFRKPSPEAYETLLWDVMAGDTTLFMRADQVEAAWCILMPILDFWAANPPMDFPNYAAGTWGPEAAEGLVSSDSRYWLFPTSLTEDHKVNDNKPVSVPIAPVANQRQEVIAP